MRQRIFLVSYQSLHPRSLTLSLEPYPCCSARYGRSSLPLVCHLMGSLDLFVISFSVNVGEGGELKLFIMVSL